MRTELLDARLRLAMTPGLGPILTRRLEDAFGGPVGVCGATGTQMRGVEGIGPKRADAIRRAIDEADIDAEWALVEQHGATLLAIDDPAYPTLLRHIIDPPPVLYVRGALRREDALSLGVVGSRKCTAYGREQADRLSALCSQAGLTIVSGGARGIDGAAHRATLRLNGRTIAVLGSGLARPYPAEHVGLFDEIADGHGAVITECPMTAPPVADNFPRRNRIISGLSLGVLVVEADQRSGALITARLAAEEHHREVMALPGRVDSRTSSGCHKIIREGWATLVTSPGEILDCLGDAGQTLKVALADEAVDVATPTSPVDQPNLKPEQRQVYDAITVETASIDDICRRSGLPTHQIITSLTHLQIVGLVERLPGNRVKRKM
ncbi:MAG: DNA-protecting protein DprA [Phycisphaera sp.]|nr:DNA-protecting protein DprA [Phycisphaera sp.]